MTHEFYIPKPLFLSFLFNTNTNLILDERDEIEIGHEVKLIEVDTYNGNKTGRELKKVVFQILKPSLYKSEEVYYQLTIVSKEQYNRLNKLPGLQT